MQPHRPEEPRVELPRGEIEIIPPGQTARDAGGRQYDFGTGTASRSFVFSSRSGGILSTVIVMLGVAALFALLLGTFAVVAAIALALFAAYALRNTIRRWLGR